MRVTYDMTMTTMPTEIGSENSWNGHSGMVNKSGFNVSIAATPPITDARLPITVIPI